MTKASVVKLVSNALKKHTHPAFDAEILIQTKDLRQRDGWWYIPVHPSKEVKSIYGYYDVLAMAAEELDNTDLKIQFIPV